MYVHIAIHKPRPEKVGELLDSMHRAAASLKGLTGLISVQAMRDEATGWLFGVAMWESKAHWEAGRPYMIEAIKDDPFEEWEDVEPEVFHLVPA